eukprot:TRINITY_DN10590_c0_g1_i1.p1 TRINITY_DN10590_c0_g1~~TRINITY_DN10590_c0_g1_i1.p1  ORF type:complete len:737 (-),score=83.20 TRINITY_DN10590_c0_g1_i1:156-2366(-)
MDRTSPGTIRIAQPYQAAWAGEVKVVKFLLRHEADVNLRTRDGQTALDIAPVGPVHAMLLYRNRGSSFGREDKRKIVDGVDNKPSKRLRLETVKMNDFPDLPEFVASNAEPCCTQSSNDTSARQNPATRSLGRIASGEAEARRQQELQATNSREEKSIWRYVKEDDSQGLLNKVKKQPEVLQQRGSLGETPLHSLCLYQHFELARCIASRYPKLITDQYSKPHYYGENCLHMAIVAHQIDMVHFFLETGHKHGLLDKLLGAKATGTFFQRGKPCYYGESPLGFAVSMNMVGVVHEMIWSYSASMEDEDSNGNNILHLAVEQRLPEMYDFIISTWGEWAEGHAQNRDLPLTRRRNKENLTPLCLAAKYGYAGIFDHILNTTCETEWTFGPVTSVLLPLDEVDYIPGVAVGAIEHIIQEGHLDLLMLPLIQELLTRKWEVFAKDRFTWRFKMALSLAIAFSLMVIFPHPSSEKDFAMTRMIIHRLCYFYTALVTLCKLCVELREMHKERWGYFVFRGAGFFENIVSLTFCFCFPASQVLEMLDAPHSATLALTLSGLLCWVYLLWFLLGFSTTGHLVVMIWTILLGDMKRFACLMSIFLMGFSLAFFISATHPLNRGPSTFAQHFFHCFKMMTSNVENDKESHGGQDGASDNGLVVVYSILVTTLLLNILIAMMNDTYNKVSGMAEQQWRLERARIIMSIESELLTKERQSAKYRYWFEIKGKRYLQLDKVSPTWARS